MPAFCVKRILHNIREYRSNINFCGDLDVSGCVSFYQNNKTKYNALLYIAFDDVNHYGVCIVCDVSKFTASSVFMLTIRQAPTELNTCPTPPPTPDIVLWRVHARLSARTQLQWPAMTGS